MIALALEIPLQWPQFSLSLAEAMNGNATALYRIISRTGMGNEVRLAVTCADNAPFSRSNQSDWPTPERIADVALHTLKTTSRRWGVSLLTTEPDGGCEFWATNKLEDYEDGKAAERFAGPWNVRGTRFYIGLRTTNRSPDL